MKDLTINDRVYTPGFNFAFSKEIEKTLADSQTTGFDNLIYGLLDEDPDILVAAIYASFASLKGAIRPTEDQIADALTNDFADEDKAHRLFLDVVKELSIYGFLHLKLIRFKKNLEKVIEIGTDRWNKLLTNGRELTDAKEIADNKSQTEQVETGLDQLKQQLADLDKMITEANQPQIAEPALTVTP